MIKTALLLCFLAPINVCGTSEWGSGCLPDCQCYMTTLVQTIMSRWLPGNKEVRAAFCVIDHDTPVLKVMQSLPSDTEALTVLQTVDAPPTTISFLMMSHLTHLKGVDFQGSGKKPKKLHLAPDSLKNLHQLQFVSLVGVNLPTSEKVFANVSSLECIQMVHCEMEAVTWHTFEGLRSLRELYVVQSGIAKLDDLAFSDTPRLRRMSLSHNAIASVEADVFAGLLQLELLDLSNNLIDRLSLLSFPPLPKLNWLELKHNPIKVIFPNCFQYLNATQRISFGHSKQHIHLMKFSFKGLTSLIFLKIPNIENNILQEHMFYGLNSLLHLTLQGQVMTTGSRAFMGAHKTLEKLVLHDCRMKKVSDDAFHGLSKLKSLDLSNNQLKYILDYTFEPLENLEELILSQNLFQTLPEAIFEPLTALRMLRLDANPWNCTCAMASWNEQAATHMYNRGHNPCAVEGGSTVCADVAVGGNRDPRIVPQCEYPEEYRGTDVFKVMQVMGCHLSERD